MKFYLKTRKNNINHSLETTQKQEIMKSRKAMKDLHKNKLNKNQVKKTKKKEICQCIL